MHANVDDSKSRIRAVSFCDDRPAEPSRRRFERAAACRCDCGGLGAHECGVARTKGEGEGNLPITLN